jgi:hypothetical protein
MKKLIAVIAMLLLSFAFVSCSEETDYLEQMTELSEPKALEINAGSLRTKDVYATHELDMNEYEILYYLPEKVEVEDRIYINDLVGFYIFTAEPIKILGWYGYEEADRAKLELIFGD